MSSKRIGIFLLFAVALPSIASAVVIEGIETQGTPPVPPSAPPPIERAASSVFINFDDVTAPCTFSQMTALKTQYVALGVTFSGPAPRDGGGISNECGNWSVTGYSPPNFVAFQSAAGAIFSDGGLPRGPETLTFSEPVGEVSILAASPTPGTTATMYAYNSHNILVASHTVFLVPGLQLMIVRYPGIVRVVIDGPGKLILDDLAFTSGTVPTLNATWGKLKTIYR